MIPIDVPVITVSYGGLSHIGGKEVLVTDPSFTDSGSQDGFLENFHLGIGVVGKVEGGCLNDGGFLGGSEFIFSVVGQDAVPHLCREDGRESVDFFDLFVDHLAADDDVADQLPLFRVVIAGEGGELAHLADIMQQSDAHEEISLEQRVALAVEVAELGNAQSVFAESADKTVVYRFRSRRQFKSFDELCIVHKKHLQKLFEVRVLDGIHKLQDRLVHVIDIPFGNRQIIGRVILPFVAESRAADIELQVST